MAQKHSLTQSFMYRRVSMENLPSQAPAAHQRVEIDTSRPFRSVKEAVALFGERFLVGEVYAEKPAAASGNSKPIAVKLESTPVREIDLALSLQRLEAELGETKLEVKNLKARESATEKAIASLNHELRKNISRLAIHETSAVTGAAKKERCHDHGALYYADYSDIGGNIDGGSRYLNAGVPYKKRQSLAELLSIREQKEEDDDEEEEKGEAIQWRQQNRKMLKKKPLIPLVSDVLHIKKRTSRQG